MRSQIFRTKCTFVPDRTSIQFPRRRLGLSIRPPTASSPPLTAVGWIFGDRQFGDTFLYQHNGIYFESRVSYYRAINRLDFTTGRTAFRPDRFETALGRRMSPDEPPLCFGCHSTGASTDGQFHPDRLIPGVTCEACHGPGAQHVAQMSLEHDARTPTLIFNPARLVPADSVDFCGACHRTAADVSPQFYKWALSAAVSSLRFRAKPLLEKWRCATHLHSLPQPSQTAGARGCVLRQGMRELPFASERRRERPSSCNRHLQSIKSRVCELSHAEIYDPFYAH